MNKHNLTENDMKVIPRTKLKYIFRHVIFRPVLLTAESLTVLFNAWIVRAHLVRNLDRSFRRTKELVFIYWNSLKTHCNIILTFSHV